MAQVPANLKLVHFQLTRRCNLSCVFCPQRKIVNPDREIKTQEWLEIVDELSGINPLPDIVIWGGEPLLADSLPDVLHKLKENNFRTALVTNGLLLSNFADLINRTVDTLYVSVDGPASIHDKIRGMPGLFNKIKEGLSRIDESVKKVCLCTVCEDNCRDIPDMPHTIFELGFHNIIMQNLIYCSTAQAEKYRQWLKTSFSQDAPEIGNWIIDSFGAWTKIASENLRKINANALAGKYPLETLVYPAEFAGDFEKWFKPSVELKSHNSCGMPSGHVSIMPDGSVHFCVDFCDLSLGNITGHSLEELLNSPTAEQFRKDVSSGKNPLCGRCPWLYNNQLKID